jgi:hypothetical protein
MLAGRLVQTAKGVLEEYSRFQIIAQLKAAATLSASRANDPQSYIRTVPGMRAWAQTIINQSVVEKYPDDLQDLLKKSRYAPALPERIARIVLNGFPDDPSLAISSSEVNFIIQLANTLVGDFGALATVANKFGIGPITVPPDEVSFDVLIPRSYFADSANDFIGILSRFTKIMSYLTELTTGSEKQPTLIYTSTSDPVTGLALLLVPAIAFLTFYSQLLDVATKHLSFLKLLKEFRDGPLNEPTSLKEEIATAVDRALENAVARTISSVPNEVPSDRVNEIKIAISRDARVVMEAIVGGARIGITIESLDKIPEMSKEVPGFEAVDVNEVLSKQKAIEHQLAQEFYALGQASPALIEKKD